MKYQGMDGLIRLIRNIGWVASSRDSPVLYKVPYFTTVQDYMIKDAINIWVYDRLHKKRRRVTLRVSSSKRDHPESSESELKSLIYLDIRCLQSLSFISSEVTRDSTRTILCSIICFCLPAATHSEPHKLAWPCVNWTLQQTRLPQVDEDGDEMMEIEEEAVGKLCIQVGLEPAGSADEKHVGEGRSIIEQGTEDTNVDMEEAIPLQAENHKILISSCAKPSRNTLESCEEPAGEKRFLSSSTSKLITEESPKEMVVFGSSCITSGSEKESSSEESPEEKLEIERTRWMDAESKWISLAEELRTELDASKALAEKLTQELDTENKCAEELKEAIQMAMEGHACILEQYADLEEKHIHLLARHRRIHEGIDDVKKAASKVGVREAESKFINALAAEISALKSEREKERRL
ncbi:hypothetical protein SADUNF_Sadunf18G0110900 [Salix dunnii]|uniref:Uncharacterized protein n=1 Tax=Salix dunnii TaxID=1413687 RepID=A0A835J541_9ROSI|nr:hypothetical protein SADUNF_Sadunf18G0110900 [Salix dunnii]